MENKSNELENKKKLLEEKKRMIDQYKELEQTNKELKELEQLEKEIDQREKYPKAAKMVEGVRKTFETTTEVLQMLNRGLNKPSVPKTSKLRLK